MPTVCLFHESVDQVHRKKLGAAHFDEEDRKRWQRDLLEVTEGLQILGTDALAFQVKELTDGLLWAVERNRIEPLI